MGSDGAARGWKRVGTWDFAEAVAQRIASPSVVGGGVTTST
jgi:hypothetical protein